MDLTDQVAIVTGSSRGIGRAIALELGRAGAWVVVAARTKRATPRWPGSIYETARQIRRRGGRARAVRTDVASATDVERMVDSTLREWGRIGVLINNAGVMGPNLPFLDTPLDLWTQIMASNLFGTFICCQAVAPHMAAQGFGTIVNITSGAAVRTGFLNVPYGVSKAGIDRLTLGLRAELREKGVACVSLSPPMTDTSTMRQIYAGQDISGWAQAPELTARAVRLLLEDDALQYSGQVLSVRQFLSEKERG